MPLFGANLERGVEILGSLFRVLHVVFDIAAVYVRFHHLGVAFDSPRVVVDGLIQQLRMLVDMAFEQREVRLLG